MKILESHKFPMLENPGLKSWKIKSMHNQFSANSLTTSLPVSCFQQHFPIFSYSVLLVSLCTDFQTLLAMEFVSYDQGKSWKSPENLRTNRVQALSKLQQG